MMKNKYNIGENVWIAPNFQLEKGKITGIRITNKILIYTIEKENTESYVEEKYVFKSKKEAKQQALEAVEEFCSTLKKDIINA